MKLMVYLPKDAFLDGKNKHLIVLINWERFEPFFAFHLWSAKPTSLLPKESMNYYEKDTCQ